MKRIVILSAFLTPFRSGAEACAEEVPHALKNDHDFVMITSRLRRNLPKHDTLNGIPVMRVGVGLPIDKWLFPFLGALEARRHKPVIVHAVLETFAGMALYCCKWTVRGAKRVLTCQTTNRSFLKGPIVRAPHAVTAISNALARQIHAFGRHDVVLIPNGIDVRGIESACGKHAKIPGRVLFVGRLEKMKGVNILLHALAQIKTKKGVSNMDVRIVGDGSLRSSLAIQAQELGLADCVTFVGHVPAPAVYEEFAQAQIFCGLSRSEALGNVFLEAQAAGCAVIATTVGGIPDIVKDGETGVLVAPDDAQAAANAIERLMSDQALLGRLSKAGQEHAKGFDWSAIAKRYEEVYESL